MLVTKTLFLVELISIRFVDEGKRVLEFLLGTSKCSIFRRLKLVSKKKNKII